jgi:hypothetical protein
VKPGLTHRLRRHKLREYDEHVSFGWWQSGDIHHVLVCSCGQSWMRHEDPLTGKVFWR